MNWSDNNMNDAEKLVELKKLKLDLIDSIVYYDLEKEENYNIIKEKYEEYRKMYLEITNEEPKNSLESLIKLKQL